MSRALYDALILPPTNHLANGGFQSNVFSQEEIGDVDAFGENLIEHVHLLGGTKTHPGHVRRAEVVADRYPVRF